MKAKLLLSFLLILLTVSVWGQQITEQQAKERVQQFLNENGAAKARGLSASMVSAKVEAQSIYAFNLEGGGYIIASSDSRALPVLGYSDKGTIDWDRMPDNMRYWLKQYDDAMATLGKSKAFRDGNSIFAKASTRAAHEAIAPLIKTAWYQTEPYWDKCPLYDGADYTLTGEPCPTGCVATAMAQVMNYWQWPKSSPEIPAYDQPTAFQGKEKIWNHPALPAVTFDWANMIENYEKKNPMTGNWEVVGTDVEKDAVATLMQYCGQSIYMDYHPDGCSSWGSYVAEALAKYFCYDAGVRLAPRIKYTIDEWENLVYDELAAGRPVVYGGAADDGGHEFVCDGYDGSGLYHINWGWGGSNDGYFSLSVLNPYNNTSTGSSSSSIGYCMAQDMVIGIQPAPEGTAPTFLPPAVYLFGDSPYELGSDGNVKLGVCVDVYDRDVAFDFGFGMRGDDGTLTPLFTEKFNQHVGSTSFYGLPLTIDAKDPVFASGETVVLYPMMKFADSDWQLLGSVNDHIYGGVDKAGLWLVTYTPEVTISDVKITAGTGRIAAQSQISFTVTNSDKIELRSTIAMIPMYYGNIDPSQITGDTPFEWGDWCMSAAYIRPGETADVPFSFKPMDGGTLGFQLYDNQGGYMGSAFYVFDSSIVGCYDDFVRNDSHLDVDYIYTRDHQQTSFTEGDNYRTGHYTLHVCFTDNNAPGKPAGSPAETIYAYGAIRDYNFIEISDKKLTDEAVDYLTKLPVNGGEGKWQLAFDVDFDIRLGGIYSYRAYFLEPSGEGNTGDTYSSWAGGEFNVFDDPAIHVAGDTILTSGQELNLELELNTGYPYDESQFTGNEQGRWALYTVEADGSLTELKTDKWSLGFDDSNPDKAIASTRAIKEKLADGHYLLRVASDWSGLGTRDINILVGSTAISGTSVDATTAKGPYTDLQGRQHDVHPTRKGIYINNGRKVIMK